MERMPRGFSRAAIGTSAFAVLVLAGTVQGQYASDFEALSASDTGVILTGQDAFYIPPNTTSVDYLAYTYTGNVLGVPANPNGGNQFVAGTGPAGSAFARAQRDVSYAGADVWSVSFDIVTTFTGTLPTAQNAGSFSTQVFPDEATFILLSRWTDTNTAANWNADVVWFDAAGNQLTEEIPDAGFQGLLADHWYRWASTFDLVSNRVLEVSVTDLTTETTVTHNPVDRYLFGGSAGAPTPTGFRFFAGSSTNAGNTLAFDNPAIAPVDSGQICPDTFTLVNGIESSGAFGDTCGSDDVRWTLSSTTFDAVFSPAPINLEVSGNVGTGGATLTFTMEGHPTFGGGTAFITVALFNFTTGLFDQSVFAAQPDGPPDVVYSKTVDNSAGDYVDVDGSVRSRITGAKTAAGPVRLNIDDMFWE